MFLISLLVVPFSLFGASLLRKLLLGFPRINLCCSCDTVSFSDPTLYAFIMKNEMIYWCLSKAYEKLTRMAYPTLISDHVGTNPIIILERHAQHSHLTMWEPIPQPCQKGPVVTFDTCEERIQHACSKRLNTYIWHMWGINPSYMLKNDLHLHSTHARNQSNMHVRKGSALTSDTWRNQSNMHVQKDVHSHLNK